MSLTAHLGRLLRHCAPSVVLLALSLVATSAPAQKSDIGRSAALYQSGTRAFQAGDLRKAHADFARLVSELPQAWAAHTAYGDVLLAEGEPALALKEFEQSTRIHAGDQPTLVGVAMAQHALHHEAEAIAAFERALAIPGAPPMAANETAALAAARFAVGDRQASESLLQGALGHTSTGEEKALLLDTLGMVQAQTNRMEEARTTFQRAVEADGKLASAHAHLGSAALAMNNPAGAVPELEAALRLGDHVPSTSVQLGRAELALGSYEKAIESEKKALLLQPGLYEAQYALALALQAAGRVEESLPVFAEALRSRPANAELLTNYGLALVQKGDAPGALQMYSRALAAGGASATLHEDMGVAYLQQNDIDHAVEQFRAGLLLDPANANLHYDLGLAWKLKDDLPASAAELRKAEELDPKLPDPPYTLGVLLMQGGNFAEAGEQLRKAVALQPANGEAWSLLGSVYKQAGEGAKAAAALREAVRLQPGQPGAHVTLAAVLAESGDREGAAAERKIAADLSRSAVGHQRAEFSLKSGRALLATGKVDEALVQLEAAVNAEPGSPATHLALADALARAGRADEARAERDRGNLLSGSPAKSPR